MSLYPEISLAAREWFLRWLEAYLAEQEGAGGTLEPRTHVTQAARVYGQFGGGQLTGRQSNLTARPGQLHTTVSIGGQRFAVGDTRKKTPVPLPPPRNSPVVTVSAPYQPVRPLSVVSVPHTVTLDGETITGPSLVALPRSGDIGTPEEGRARLPVPPEVETLLKSEHLTPGGPRLTWDERLSIGAPYPRKLLYGAQKRSLRYIDAEGVPRDKSEVAYSSLPGRVWGGASLDPAGHLVLPVRGGVLYAAEDDPARTVPVPAASFEPVSVGVYAGDPDNMEHRPIAPVPPSVGGGAAEVFRTPGREEIIRWTKDGVTPVGYLDAETDMLIYGSFDASVPFAYDFVMAYGDGPGPRAGVTTLGGIFAYEGSGAESYELLGPGDALQPNQEVGRGRIVVDGGPAVYTGNVTATVNVPGVPGESFSAQHNWYKAHPLQLAEEPPEYQIVPTTFSHEETLSVSYAAGPETWVLVEGLRYRVFYRHSYQGSARRRLNLATVHLPGGNPFQFGGSTTIGSGTFDAHTPAFVALQGSWSFRAGQPPPTRSFDPAGYRLAAEAYFENIPDFSGPDYPYAAGGLVAPYGGGYAVYLGFVAGAVQLHPPVYGPAAAAAAAAGRMVPFFDEALLENRVSSAVVVGAGDFSQGSPPSRVSPLAALAPGGAQIAPLEVQNLGAARTFSLSAATDGPLSVEVVSFSEESFSYGDPLPSVTLGAGENRLCGLAFAADPDAPPGVYAVTARATAAADPETVSAFSVVVEVGEVTDRPLRMVNRLIYDEPEGYDPDTGAVIPEGPNELFNPLDPDARGAVWYGLEWESPEYVCDAFRATVPDEEGNPVERLYAVAVVRREGEVMVLVSVDGVKAGEWPLELWFPSHDGTLHGLNGETWGFADGPLMPSYHSFHADHPLKDAAYLRPFRARVRGKQDKKVPADCPVVVYFSPGDE